MKKRGHSRVVLLSLLVGFAGGFSAALGLAAWSSQTFVRVLEAQYLGEQRAMGARAAAEGGWPSAARHYANVLDVAGGGPGSTLFDTGESTWTWSFPLAGVVLHEIGRVSDEAVSAERTCEDGARIRGEDVVMLPDRASYAYALEQAGRSAEARRQYEVIARGLCQADDLDAARRFAAGVVGDPGAASVAAEG